MTNKAQLAAAQKRIADLEAKLHSQAKADEAMAAAQDLIMDVMTEVLRGMRPGHVDYTQKLAREYYESATGKPWDEPVRRVVHAGGV